MSSTSKSNSSNKKNTKRTRGRPRKNQVSTQQNSTKTKQTKDEEIILHLPITSKDINRYSDNKSIESNTNSIDNNMDKTTDNVDKNIFTVNDIGDDSSESEDDFDIKELKTKVAEQNKTIEGLEQKIEQYQNILGHTAGSNNRKVFKIKSKLVSVDNEKQVVPKETNYACMWCTYNFDTTPYYLPEKLKNDEYHVHDSFCFCCDGCAMAYNFYDINDNNVWSRYGLFKNLYKLQNINIAPRREAFEKFGGPVSYDEHIKNQNMNSSKKYRLIMPPMTSIVSLIEEDNVHSTHVSVSLADIKRKTVLKRTKPLPNAKNNLFKTFGIK